jgi:hypothetical protein
MPILKALSHVTPNRVLADGSAAVRTRQIQGKNVDGSPFTTIHVQLFGGEGARPANENDRGQDAAWSKNTVAGREAHRIFVPDTQHVLSEAAGMTLFMQHLAFELITPGLTYVRAAHFVSALQSASQSSMWSILTSKQR